jgi:hypothetical protein
MMIDPEAQRNRARLLVWWILWGSMLVGLGLSYFVLGRGKLPPGSPQLAKNLAGLVGFVPLFVSIVLRWLVLPRCNDLRRAFPLFVLGLASAEACGLLGIFLGGPYRDDLFVLGLLGLGQYVPFFAKGFLEPKPQGYIPNN